MVGGRKTHVHQHRQEWQASLREPEDFRRLHIEAGDDVTREQVGCTEPIAAADGTTLDHVAALKQLDAPGTQAGGKFRRDDQERAVRLGEPLTDGACALPLSRRRVDQTKSRKL